MEYMQNLSEDSMSDVKTIDFGYVAVDTIEKKYISIQNNSDKQLSYRIAHMYMLNSIDRVFKTSISSTSVDPDDSAEVCVTFKPTLAGQSFTEYYVIDDTGGNVYRLTVTGRCFGPTVKLDKKKLTFRICKNVSEQRKNVINIINKSNVDTTYQWLVPIAGQGNFQISTGNCGLVRANETITTTIIFTGTALGIYTAELVCLVLNQAPLYLNVVATIVLPGNPLFKIQDHVLEKSWTRKCAYTHLMENSLRRLGYIPSASAFERYFDFGTGCVDDVTKNISQTLCVTNHEQEDGYFQWMPDPENVFLVDPISTIIPPNESRLFTIRFRPKVNNEVYGYLMCGDFQHKKYYKNCESAKLKHTWFRVPCIANTWLPCTEWTTQWGCPKEIVLPPTVPGRKSFHNFMLSNKLEIPMYFKFDPPTDTNFVVLPMCGIVPCRGWQIISLALEPITSGDYYETWDILINKVQKESVCFVGNAEESKIEIMSQGYSPAAHAMYEFPATITGCANYTTAYLHNLTRMDIHIRVLSSVSWLGGDNCGTIVLPPKEIVRYQWWFFPIKANMVYDTTVTCSTVCLIDGRPVGEPTEIFINIIGFSELPDLRVLPKSINLHDIVVSDNSNVTVTLYNYGTCYFTSKLYHVINGMGDDHTNDKLVINSPVNSLKPSTHCEVTFTVTPEGAGLRQIDIKYTVLYRTEFDEVEEIHPISKTICILWYIGIYPTIKVKRTISVKCPVILSNHCVWNITNVDELNKALVNCRPKVPLSVNLYAPDLCVRIENVELIFVLGSVYRVPTEWTLRREKICDCEMMEVQIGISTYEQRHTCTHRHLIELSPSNGIVTPDDPNLIYLRFNYNNEGLNTLCYVLSLPNERSINIYLNIYAQVNKKAILTPLRRLIDIPEYLAVLNCGKVPINNLDPVIRIVWLYNPTNVFTTWRLLRGNMVTPDAIIRCLLYFAEVPPLGKLAIPFSFMPTEMIDYEVVFQCSFGYDTVKILVKGQGGLPNCWEVRLDIPMYCEKVIRAMYRREVLILACSRETQPSELHFFVYDDFMYDPTSEEVYLSSEHITMPIIPTHSLYRDIVAICNDTDHVVRFIWLPERIANIVNIVMTPCWGVIQPKASEWITMTVYTLQAPATFTTTVACEILDLTERRRYQRNELLRRNKIEKCNQEFIITEDGLFHPELNDSPPYVLEVEKPQPYYLSMTVSISSKSQLDGYPRLLLKQMWEQTPPYDLLSSDLADYGSGGEKGPSNNNMSIADIIRIIDGILWDSLHSKMFRNQIEYYSKEEIPTYSQLVEIIESDLKPQLSRRVTSGICDAIVNKAVFHVYKLNTKHDISILDAE